MTFSVDALIGLCRHFCEEIEAITHETDHFLAQFHTEERFRFSDSEKIKNMYLEPYGCLIASLLASLKTSDRLGVRLTALLAAADSPSAIENMPRVEALWDTYEQYRADVMQYLEVSQQYWKEVGAQRATSTAPLVQATRVLIGTQRQAYTVFSENAK